MSIIKAFVKIFGYFLKSIEVAATVAKIEKILVLLLLLLHLHWQIKYLAIIIQHGAVL